MMDALLFRPDDMPQFSPEMSSMHIELYQKYVKTLNEMLDDSVYMKGKGNATYSPFSEWHKKYSTVLNAIKLHEEFFRTVGTFDMDTEENVEKQENEEQKVKKELEDVFGSFNAFQNVFKEMVKSTNGWVILGHDIRQANGNGIFHLNVIEGHDKFVLTNFQPILTIDTWEHAYMLDFKLDKDKYVDLCFENLNWQYVLANIQKTEKLNA